MAGTDRVVFLSVPESLREAIPTHDDYSPEEPSFRIDPAIPIPVELPPGAVTLDLEYLSWEMILSGMIRVIAENTQGLSGGYFDSGSTLSSEDINYYRRFVLSVKPDIMEEFTQVAILKAKNGDYDLALEIMEALGGLFPRSQAVLLNRALILEHKADALERSGREAEAEGENARAYQAYQELLALDPVFPDGLFNAGFFFLKNQNFDKAKGCFAAYIPLAEEPDKQKRAEAILKEIKSRNLDDTMFRESYEAIRKGEVEQGLTIIRDFLERHPQVWNGWFILGWGLRKLGRWEDGVTAFRKALELGGNNGDTRNELAICLMELGEYGPARKELELALREEPENIKLISNLGVLAMKKGDDDEAAAFFRAVLALEPGDLIAQEGLAVLGM